MDRNLSAWKTSRQFDAVAVLAFVAIVVIPWSHWFDGSVTLDSAHLPFASPGHPLGTDNIGRDLLVRLTSAIRECVIPLWVCVSVAAISGVSLVLFGFALGERVIAGWAKLLAAVLLTLARTIAAVPVFVLVMLCTLWIQQSSIQALFLPVSLVVAARFVELIRLLYLRDKSLSYWTASIAAGSSHARLLWRYGINGAWKNQLLDELLFTLSVVVSVEAALSYLGIGVAEPSASFGNMLSSHFDDYLRGKFWILSTIAITFLFTASIPLCLRKTNRGHMTKSI